MWLVICLVIIIVALLWLYMDPFYWKKKKIPYLIPLPLIGNLFPSIIYGIRGHFKSLNKQFPGHKYFGMHFLTKPTLYIKDPDLIQQMLVTDFEHFTSHGMYGNQDRDPGGGNLFHIYGQQWKEMRGKLSPYFTPAKVKAMLGYVDNTTSKVCNIIDKNIAEGKPCEMKSVLINTTTDIITQAIFGVASDAFENENSVFSEIIMKMFKKKFTARLFMSVTSSRLYDLLNLTVFESKFNSLISSTVKKTIHFRKQNNVYVKDFLQGMMELLDTESVSEETHFPDQTRVPVFDLNTVTSQAIILHVGGVETSALTMTFLLYEMARDPKVQEKCRAEINAAVSENRQLTVLDINQLPYLTATIQETMRMHSSFVIINRECTKQYKLPDSDLTIEPGTFILMSPLSIQREEDYFPQPEIFRPERFLEEEKGKIKPGTYFPFGIGPRTCLGMNFAMSEMKLVIGRLLQNYEFSFCSKTQIPVKHSKYVFLTTPAEEMWLQVKPLHI